MGRKLAEICLAIWPDNDEILAASADSSFIRDYVPALRDMPASKNEEDASSKTDPDFDSDTGVDPDLTAACAPDLALEGEEGEEHLPESQRTEDDFDEVDEEGLDNCALAASKFTWSTETRPAGNTLRVLCMSAPQGLRPKVEEYAGIWEQHANIHFDFVARAPAEIRISFERGKGHWSKLGCLAELVTDQSEATMNLDVNEGTEEHKVKRAVLHEFGHALGLVHEHSSPNANIPWNKEAVYARCGNVGWSRRKTRRQVLQRYDKSEMSQYSAFDPLSIMIYAVSPSLTDGKLRIRWNGDLSTMDKKFIAKLYPITSVDTRLKQAVMNSPAAAMSTAGRIPIRAGPPASRPVSLGILQGKYCDDPDCPMVTPCDRDFELFIQRHGSRLSARRTRT